MYSVHAQHEADQTSAHRLHKYVANNQVGRFGSWAMAHGPESSSISHKGMYITKYICMYLSMDNWSQTIFSSSVCAKYILPQVLSVRSRESLAFT